MHVSGIEVAEPINPALTKKKYFELRLAIALESVLAAISNDVENFSACGVSISFSKHLTRLGIYVATKALQAVSSTLYFNSLKFSVLGRYGPSSSPKITSAPDVDVKKVDI